MTVMNTLKYVNFQLTLVYEEVMVCNVHVDGLVQERHNSIANALELHLSCTNPSMYCEFDMGPLLLAWFNWD